MCNYYRQTDWAKHSLQASSPIRGSCERSRESSTRKKTRVRKGRLQRPQINFHFHPGNRRKPQSVKTVTGNKKCVNVVSYPHKAKPNAPVTLALSVPETKILQLRKKARQLKEDNWCGPSSLNRCL